MKTRNRIILTAALAVILGGFCADSLWAEGSADRSFFKSIGVVYTMSIQKDSGDTTRYTNHSMGLTANFFFFDNADVGYFLNPAFGWRMKTVPAGQDEKDEANLKGMDMYFGVTFGPGFLLYNSSDIGLLAGAGPDLTMTVHLSEGEAVKVFMGIGAGGTLETRMKFHNEIGAAGGLLVKYNLAPYTEDSVFTATPYLGVGC
jgi:hypothetical protein